MKTHNYSPLSPTLRFATTPSGFGQHDISGSHLRCSPKFLPKAKTSDMPIPLDDMLFMIKYGG